MTYVKDASPATYRDALGMAGNLYAKAKKIMEDPNSTTDQKNNIEEILIQARAQQARAGQLQEIEDGMALIKSSEGGSEEHPKKKPDFKSWEEFVYAVWVRHNNRKADPRLFSYNESTGKSVKDMSGSTGASGGYLLSTQFEKDLYGLTAESSDIWARAHVIRMTRRQVYIPAVKQSTVTSGQPGWYGGIIFYWGDENEEKTASEAEFRRVTLTANKLYGYTSASDELVNDTEEEGISLSDFLSGPMGFAGGILWHQEFNFLQGPGGSRPLGVINADCTIPVPRQTAGSVSYIDLTTMMQNFRPNSNGVWYISQSLMSDMIQLSGPSSNPSFVWQTNAVDGSPVSFIGFPVIWSEKVPVKGQPGDVGLYDWSQYVIGNRQATTISSTIYDKWKFDETSWRVTSRIDGQPYLDAPITYQDGVTQISPFVILADAEGS